MKHIKALVNVQYNPKKKSSTVYSENAHDQYINNTTIKVLKTLNISEHDENCNHIYNTYI